MINTCLNIDVDYEAMGVKPSPRQTMLTTYILDGTAVRSSIEKKRPAVIICPGGGYEATSPRESEVIALSYCAAGFHAFVLDYSVYPSSFPAAIVELSKAVMYVREIADEHNIDPKKVFVCGFSAGGHLAASLGVHYKHGDVVKFSGAKNEENKPNGIILSYPVITGEKGKAHQGSIDRFSGGKEWLYPLASLENYVTKDTPEMFIWHTFSDDMVPVVNSLKMANALEENDVKFEMHIYPDGCHGLSLAKSITAPDNNHVVPAVQNWMEMSVRWIKDFK